MSDPPSQGDVVWADPDPTRGREQAKPRPFVVVSVDELNSSRIDLVLVVALTRTDSGNALHVRIDPPEGELTATSYAMPEQLRAMSHDRLAHRMGSLRATTLLELLQRCRLLLRDPRH